MATQQEILQFVIETSGNEEIVATAKAMLSAGQAGETASPKVQALVDQLAKLATTDELIASLTREKVALAETGDALALAKIKLAELQAQLSATATPSATLERAFAKQTATVSSLDAQYNQHQANLARTNNALQAAGVNTSDLDSEQRKVQASIAAVSSEAQGLGKNLGTVAVATEEAGEKAEKSSTVFGSLREHLLEIVSVAALVEVALKGIEFGAESIRGAADVEQSLARVQALAGTAAASFEELDKSVEQAAVAVNTSTQTAATGLAALVSQGLSADAAMKLLIPTLQLAKIAQVDVNTAAGDVAQTLKAFNIPVDQAGTVIDQLTVASHGAAGGLAAMANAAAQLAPDAKTLGLTFTQTISILGLLESKGLDTEKAVRGLRSVFQELQNPVSGLRVQLLALGDGTSDFTKAVAALTSGTPRAQEALLSLDGPTRSLVEVLGQAGPDALAKFAAGLGNTAGAASKTSSAIDSTLTGSFTKFTHAIDLIGEKLAAPILKPFADEFTKLAGEINEFAESDDFKSITEKVTEMATNAAEAFDTFLHNTDFKGFADNAIKDLDGLAKSLEALARNASTIATAVGKVGDAVGIAYRGAATAIDTVVAGGAKFVDVVTDVAQAGDALVEGNDKAAESFEKVHAAVEAVGDEAWDQAKSNASDFADDVKDLAGVTDEATEATKKTGEASADAAPKIDKHTESVKGAAEAGKVFVSSLGLVPDYIDAAGTAAGTASPLIGKLGNELTVIGGGPLQNARKGLTDAIQGLADLQRAGNATPQALAAASQAVVDASKKLQMLQVDADSAAGQLKTAFEQLHIQSQQSLKDAADDALKSFNTIDKGSANTAAGLADRQNAFLTYAQKALAASAQLGEGAQASTANDLEAKAAILGVSDALHGLERQSASSSAALISDTNKYSESLRKLGDDALAASLAHQRAAHDQQVATTANADAVKESAAAADKAEKSFTRWGDAQSQASLATQKITADTSHANLAMDALVSAIQAARAQFAAVSGDAEKFFDTTLKERFDHSFSADGSGFDRVAAAIQAATDITTAKIKQQRDQLDLEVGNLDQLATKSTESFQEFGGSADKATAQLNTMITAVKNGNVDLGILGDQALARLQQALEAAQQRTQQLADEAKQATQSFNDLAQAAQDALDQQEGNQGSLEDRRHQKELDDLQAAAKAANQLNSNTYTNAVAAENKLHALKMADIEKQQQAANGGTSPSASSSSKSGSGLGGSGSGGGSQGALGGLQPIHIHVDGKQATNDGDLFGTGPAAQVLEQILRAKANSI